jgi:hypothetical protein
MGSLNMKKYHKLIRETKVHKYEELEWTVVNQYLKCGLVRCRLFCLRKTVLSINIEVNLASLEKSSFPTSLL